MVKLSKSVVPVHIRKKEDAAIAEATRQVENKLKRFIDIAAQKKNRSPYMITDLEDIREKCRNFRANFPGVALYYAVKCFGDTEVIQAVEPLVDGFDVASVPEVKKLMKLGVSPSRMTYSNPVKSEDSLRQAGSLKVKRFAYQSANELVKIKKYIPDAEVYLRVRVADQASEISFSSKFGCDLEEAKDLLLLARGLDLKPVGLTFHVGSQATDHEVWDKAVKRCAKLIEDLKAADLELTLVNLGGGFPVRYKSGDPELKDAAKVIKQAIKDADLPDNVQLMAEPGRYLVAESSAIVTTVIGVEERRGKTWLFLDTGSFQSFIEVFEFGYFPYPVYSVDHLSGKAKVKSTQHYVLTGPSCDSYDTMTFDIELPTDISIGSRLLIGVTGAYTLVYGSNFNGFKVPSVKFIN